MVPYFHFTCIQFCLCHKVPFSCKEVQRLIRPGAGVIGDVLMSLASPTSLHVFLGSKHISRKFHLPKSSCLFLRRRRILEASSLSLDMQHSLSRSWWHRTGRPIGEVRIVFWGRF